MSRIPDPSRTARAFRNFYPDLEERKLRAKEWAASFWIEILRESLARMPPSSSNAPETSDQAAAAIAPASETIAFKVLEYLRERGPAGATDEEVHQDLRLGIRTAVPRRWELCEKGLVKDSGLRRKVESGNYAVVWTVVDAVAEGQEERA